MNIKHNENFDFCNISSTIVFRQFTINNGNLRSETSTKFFFPVNFYLFLRISANGNLVKRFTFTNL